MEMKLVDRLLPVESCDNRYGFGLEPFPAGSMAALIFPCDNAIAVVTPDRTLWLNFDTMWLKRTEPLPAMDDASVNEALGLITVDPESVLDEDRCDDLDYNPDDALIALLAPFGFVNADPV